MQQKRNELVLKDLGIDTYREAVVYVHAESLICRSEGFSVQRRIEVKIGKRSILATLNTIEDNILKLNEASLSKHAWDSLAAKEGDKITLSHPQPLNSLSYVRSKIYGNNFKTNEIKEIIEDVTLGKYSDIELATFLTACAAGNLSEQEIIDLTNAMINVGDKLNWPTDIVADKHCVGGLPGNRTTLIVVPIIACCGLTIPKTSSRAITSPAGTADTMEVLAPVNLTLKDIRKVVERENACITWGGSVALSPADDILIRVERTIRLDSEGQLVASILSKKIASGANHILIDIPIGESVKVRNTESATLLKQYLESIANKFGLKLKAIFSDGSQPIGRGIGPSLEAKDVLKVLRMEQDAPRDLLEKSLTLAGELLELCGYCNQGCGAYTAQSILHDGRAWKKFQAICQAQGGMYEPTTAKYQHIMTSHVNGIIESINNSNISKLASLAGAPYDKSAGLELHCQINSHIVKGQPLFTVHSETKAQLDYALSFLNESSIVNIMSN